jgi:hypothetical protein
MLLMHSVCEAEHAGERAEGRLACVYVYGASVQGLLAQAPPSGSRVRERGGGRERERERKQEKGTVRAKATEGESA